jgi:amidophosphoribosyltransferase
LIYQELADLESAVAEGNPNLRRFDSSCFSGEYITGASAEYFARIASQRSDEAKSERRKAG